MKKKLAFLTLLLAGPTYAPENDGTGRPDTYSDPSLLGQIACYVFDICAPVDDGAGRSQQDSNAPGEDDIGTPSENERTGR